MDWLKIVRNERIRLNIVLLVGVLITGVVWTVKTMMIKLVVLLVGIALVAKMLRELSVDMVKIEKRKEHVFVDVGDKVGKEEGKEEMSKLSDKDMEVFTSASEELEVRVGRIKGYINESGHIKRVMTVTEGMKAIELYCESLKLNPERLIESETFVHKTIPYLENMMDLFIKIEREELKSNRMEDLMWGTLNTLEQLAEEVVVDYKRYTDNYVNEVSKEIKKVEVYLESKRVKEEGFKGYD